jgi:hypothetical protein
MTQLAWHVKSKTYLWKRSEFARTAALFMGDAIKKFNISTFDLVQTVKYQKPGWVMTALYQAIGLAMGAILDKTVRQSHPWENDEETVAEWVRDAILGDFVYTIPVIGGEAIAFYDYFMRGRRTSTTSTILFAPIREGLEAIGAVNKGDTERAIWLAMNAWTHTFGIWLNAPIPTVAARRLWRSGKSLAEGNIPDALSIQFGRWPERNAPRRRRRSGGRVRQRN